MERESGEYLIGDTYKHCLARGGINGKGKIDVLQLEGWERNADSLWCLRGIDETDDAVYSITFHSDSTLEIVHTQTGEPIGWPSTPGLGLKSREVRWEYTLLDESQIRIYHVYESGAVRYLWANEGETLETADELTFAAQSFCFTGYGLLLFNVQESPEPARLSFFPQWTSVVEVRGEGLEVRGVRKEMREGRLTIVFADGKRYDVLGRRVR